VLPTKVKSPKMQFLRLVATPLISSLSSGKAINPPLTGLLILNVLSDTGVETPLSGELDPDG
jgi:hypothetical protein